MNSINIPPLTIPNLKEGQEFRAFLVGYPIETFNHQTLHMELNHEKVPYLHGGPMKFHYCNDMDNASLVYNEKEVVATKGQSGGPLMLEINQQIFTTLVGIHGGNHDGQNFAAHLIGNTHFDEMMPYIEEQISEFNGEAEERKKYMQQLYEIQQQYKEAIDDREFEKEETEQKRRNEQHVQS